MSYIKTYNSWRNISSFLLEGKADDLVIKFPELKPAYDAGITNHHYLNWMLKYSKAEPIRDMIGIVKTFNKNKAKLKAKGMRSDIYQYQNPGELRRTIEDLGTSRSEKSRRLKAEEADFLGTFGDWQVWLPITTAASCELGKSTTWCTAATQSDNLFNSYIMDGDLILYYVIKSGGNPIEDPTAKLSIGLLDGRPTLSDTDTGTSVDAANKGLTSTRLKGILGSHYKPIMSAIKSNYSNLPDGQHPMLALVRLAENPNTPVETLVKLSKIVPAQVAGNPNTPVEIIRELINSKDNITIEKIAGNHNTPIEILKELIKKYITQDIDDEDDYDDEEDRKQKELEADIVASAISNPNLPAIFIEEIFKTYPNHRSHIATNPNTPVDILRELAEINFPSYNNPNTGYPINTEGDEEATKHYYYREDLARNPSTPVDVLAKLSKDGDHWVRSGVARNPNTPIEALAKLGRDKHYEVLRNVAMNPNTPAEIANKIKNMESEKFVTRDLAKNPDTSADVLRELSQNWDTNTRSHVARNPSTPVDVLAKLSKDEYEGVQVRIAENPNTPVETLVELSKNLFYDARQKVAKNPNTPVEILVKLSKDEWAGVRQCVAKNPNTPIETLVELSRDQQDSEVRRCVARNPNTPVAILAELSRDEKTWVRQDVAGNPNTPVDVLRELSRDQDENVRGYAAKNPNTPKDVSIKNESISTFNYVKSFDGFTL